MNVGRLLLFEGTAFDGFVGMLAVGVFIVLVMLVLRRPNRQRLALRIVLTGVAVVSLLLLAWQPQWQRSPRSAEAILATPGASSSAIARLADSLHTSRLYALPEAAPPRPARRAVEVVPDVGFLVRRHPEIATLHVMGEGLEAYALAALHGVAVRFYPAPPTPGIQFVSVPRTVRVGQAMRVQGQVYVDDAPAARWPYTLYLDGPGGPIDSVAVAESGTTAFSLETVPRQTGRYRYRLTLIDAPGDTLAAARLGASVKDPALPGVLVLQGAPRFETRHLKDWLAGEGGRMAIRSTVSQDRYRTEFLNQPERDLSRLTPAVLQAFDVVLLDRRTLAELSTAERRALQGAVEEEGLGLLFGPDYFDSQTNTQFFQRFSSHSLDEAEGRRVRLTWEGRVTASSIPAASSVISSAWGVEPLMQDEAGRAVAAMRQQGMGRVGLSLASETYRWVLEGNAALHAAYWSYLLATLARPSEADQWAVGVPGPVFRDAPVPLVLHTRDALPLGLVFTTDAVPDTVYLAQDPTESMRWHGTFWPRDTGWHRVTTAASDASSGPAFWFYAHSPASWQPLQAARKTQATKQVTAATPSAFPESERTAPFQRVPVPLWWFLPPFLASCAGLWLEEKL